MVWNKKRQGHANFTKLVFKGNQDVFPGAQTIKNACIFCNNPEGLLDGA